MTYRIRVQIQYQDGSAWFDTKVQWQSTTLQSARSACAHFLELIRWVEDGKVPVVAKKAAK